MATTPSDSYLKRPERPPSRPRRHEHLERRPVRDGEDLDGDGCREVLRLARDELRCGAGRREGRDRDRGEEEGRGAERDEGERDREELAVLRAGESEMSS